MSWEGEIGAPAIVSDLDLYGARDDVPAINFFLSPSEATIVVVDDERVMGAVEFHRLRPYSLTIVVMSGYVLRAGREVGVSHLAMLQLYNLASPRSISFNPL
jgi:hypothetical protein